MTKQLQQKIIEAELELHYLETISGQRWKGIKGEGWEDTAPEVVDQLVARQKRIIQSLKDGKTEILKSNNMSKIHITKAKVLKEKTVVDYYQLASDESKTEITEVHKCEPHEDLKNAFHQLAFHAATLTEMAIDESVPLSEKFSVTGFSLSGDDDDCVVITAQRLLSSGKQFTFNTPLTRFADDNENAYQFQDDLRHAIAKCKDEVKEYLNGKHGPKKQQEIPFAEGEENGGMKAVKGGKGKKKAAAEV